MNSSTDCRESFEIKVDENIQVIDQGLMGIEFMKNYNWTLSLRLLMKIFNFFKKNNRL